MNKLTIMSQYLSLKKRDYEKLTIIVISFIRGTNPNARHPPAHALKKRHIEQFEFR